MAVTQFFKYKKTDPSEVKKNILLPLIVSLAIALAAGYFFGWFSAGKTLFYIVLLFACVFAVMANLTYLIRILKGKLDHAGPSVAHVGFALLLLGAMISTSKSDTISVNQKGDVEIFGKDFSNRDNILLQIHDTVKMGAYSVTYKGSRKEGINQYYDVEYLEKDESGKYTSAFILSPRLQLNARMGNVAEPDTRHFLTEDIYTHITYADLETAKNEDQKVKVGGYQEPHNNSIAIGDTFFTSNSIVVLEKLIKSLDKAKLGIPDAEIAVGAGLKVFDVFGKVMEVMPVYYITGTTPGTLEATLDELGLRFAFWKINPETGKVDIAVSEKKQEKKEFIVMKAIVFPYINVLWMGCLIMIIGTVMAVRKRLKRSAE